MSRKRTSNKPAICVLVGATASGKTDLSLSLSKSLPIEIINSDSLQVFKHMDIGTSKPSKKMLQTVPHHLIDILDPDEPFTAKEYRNLAVKKIHNILDQNKIPLIVGGAGFYLRALIEPIKDLPSGTKVIDDFHQAYANLIEKDPDLSYIHPNDHYRISRATFLVEQGILPSKAFAKSPSDFETHWYGISVDRTVLRERIAKRVQDMFQAGLVEETEKVLSLFPQSRERLEKTIGYRECLAMLEKKISLKDAISQTTIKTNQYAKRQDTWFRKNKEILWQPLTKAADSFSVSMRATFQV